MKAFRIRLTGLQGGHSGEDIHRGRGNAISLLLRLLEASELRVVSIHGGTNRLAIPREAEAVVLAESEDAANRCVSDAKAVFRKEYSGAAPDLDITVGEVNRGEDGAGDDAESPLTSGSFRKLYFVFTRSKIYI